MRCPHCGGLLITTPEWLRQLYPKYLYDCTRCSRGFKVFSDGHWEAMYDTNNTTYSPREVGEAQQ